MDLREAVKAIESYGVISWNDTLRLIMEAAKRELEREERGPSKRLEELEQATRDASFKILPATYPDSDKAACRLYDRLHQAADLLKALREKVVPLLRQMSAPIGTISSSWSLKCSDALEALGESTP